MNRHNTTRITHCLPALSLLLCLAACLGGCSAAEMKGTPFYTGEYTRPQGPPEDRVNLWPLAYYHQPALSLLWPLGEHTDDHWAVRPLVSAYKLDRKEHEYNLLWPLCQFDFDQDDHRIFPIFFGDYRNDNSYLVVFPLAWYEQDSYFALFPAYIGAHDDETRSTHILWPVLNRKSGEQEHGWRVWPLAGDYHDRDERYRFALWPLLHEIRDGDDDTWRLALPLYWSHHQADHGWDLMAPLLWRSYAPDQSLILSWLYSAGHSPQNNWSLAFPLYYRETAGDTSRLLTPLFGKTTTPERDTRILTPLLSSYTTADQWRALWFLAPLAHARWGAGEARHHLFPLYYRNSQTDTFLSLPLSWGQLGKGRFADVLGPLFFYWSDADGHWQAFALFPFFSLFDKNDSGFWFWPLCGYSQNQHTKRGFALWPVFTWLRSATANATTVFPLFSWRDWDSSQAPNKKPERESKGWSLWCLPTFFADRYQYHTPRPADTAEIPPEFQEHRYGLWPLWKYRQQAAPVREYRQTEFSLLYWLYDYCAVAGAPQPKQDPQDTTRACILWHIMHYEREAGRKTLDIFPFITWDRKPDTDFTKFSFVWRLFRYQREDDHSLQLDLLFLPLLRSGRERIPTAPPPSPRSARPADPS